MKLLQSPSPNWNARPTSEVSCVVLHATADADTAACVRYLCDRASKVSYHSLVDRDATVYLLVPAQQRAWHAGVSKFQGRQNVNDFSVGVSFANTNTGAEPYPDVQLAVGAALVAGYMKRFPAITLDRITTHRVIAPTRKTDPSPPAFDLDAFKLRVLREVTGAGGCV